MNNPFDLKTNPRKKGIKQPEIKSLLQSIGLMAVGLLIFSIAFCEVLFLIRIITLLVGVVLFITGTMLLKKYRNACKAFEQYVQSWDKGRGMYDRYGDELNNWYKDGISPKSCNRDITYFLELQRQRLEEKGIRMKEQINPVNENSYGTATLPRKTIWYTSDMCYEEVTRRIEFQKNDTTLYKKNDYETMYETIIHSPNEEQLENLNQTCPNCGAISPVAELTKGCKYCNTQFEITDLFPRVVNHYFVNNSVSYKATPLIRNTYCICIGLVFIVSLVPGLLDKELAPPFAFLFSYFMSLFVGGICGFLISRIIMLLSLFNNGGRKRIPFFASISAKGKITRTMSRYDRYFSFDKFEGQIISLIRMAVFAKEPANLTAYKGTELDARFKDIVEMTHRASFVVKNIRQSGNILHMTLRTWWINYSEHDNKIEKTGDCIDITISRDITQIETPGFSITSVNCKNCGGSFDAVRQHCCPYCQTEYDMERESWVIEEMKLIR